MLMCASLDCGILSDVGWCVYVLGCCVFVCAVDVCVFVRCVCDLSCDDARVVFSFCMFNAGV